MRLEFGKWLQESLEQRVRLLLESVSDETILAALEQFAQRNPEQYAAIERLEDAQIDALMDAVKSAVLQAKATSPQDIVKIWEMQTSPAKMFQLMRSGMGGAPQKQKTQIPQPIMDALSNGFSRGGLVPRQLVDYLQLNGKNRSFVADGLINVRGHAYPFYRSRKMGVASSDPYAISFVQGYPIHNLTREMEDIEDQRSKMKPKV